MTLAQQHIRQILPMGARPYEDVLDVVYMRFASSHPFLPVIRFADHATMGAEALVGLGRGDKVLAWLEHHRPRPYAPPRTGIPLPEYWQQGLGRGECLGDWLTYFERELATEPVEGVLRQWMPRLVHAVDAFMFHGLIRTAHGVRALDHRDTAVRRGEVARGLALWAIGVKSPPSETTSPSVDGDVEPEILSYARAGAAAVIATPHIPNVHLVTGPMAYVMLAHHLDAPIHRLAALAFRRTHAGALREVRRVAAKEASMPMPKLDDELLDRLVRVRDAHPIKLVEAALRAYQAREDGLFLRAIAVARHLHGPKNLLGIARAMLGRHAR